MNDSEKSCHCRNDTNTSIVNEPIVDSLSEFFKILGDSTRIRILLALDSGELCVFHISEKLGMSMSAVSHQLRTLRDAKLVASRRDGRSIYYSLCDEHIKTIVETALEHVYEKE